jgi:hypothetical protein
MIGSFLRMIDLPPLWSWGVVAIVAIGTALLVAATYLWARLEARHQPKSSRLHAGDRTARPHRGHRDLSAA